MSCLLARHRNALDLSKRAALVERETRARDKGGEDL
jgi:hypothetical protein